MSFIKEFIHKPEQSNVLESSLKGVFDLLEANVNEIDRNSNISKLLTYKRIRFQRIDITNVMYSLSSLLNNSQVVSLIGGSKNTSMEKRIDIWNSMTALEQADILIMAGYYVELTDNILSTITDDIKRKRFDVVDFELCDSENNSLVKNIDFVFYDNKLVLLKEFFNDSNYRKKYLFMKNIVIDYGLTESTLGEFMKMPSNKEITKIEYNEILKGFTAAASKGPIVGEYGTALNRYKSLEGVKVYDRINADETRRHFWGNDDKIGKFTNFDFIVSMPVKLVYKTEKLDYIIKFFNNTKPAYANFIFLPELVELDTISMRTKPTIFNTKGAISGVKSILNNKKSFTEYAQSLYIPDDYLLNIEPNHNIRKGSMHKTYDEYNLFEKETHISYIPIEHILDLIPYQTKVISDIKFPFKDKVQIGKGLGGDSYYLDEDHFDLQSIADPIWSRMITGTSDSIGYNKSFIKSVMPISYITDLIPNKESLIRKLSAGIRDNAKIYDYYSDYNYITDDDDYYDSITFYDKYRAITNLNGLVDKIPELSEIIGIKNVAFSHKDTISKINSVKGILDTVTKDIIISNDDKKYQKISKNIKDNILHFQKLVMLYSKNLCDRMENIEDTTNKIVADGTINSAYLISKANIVECDSIFEYDCLREGNMFLDSVPKEYNENINADFISKESIYLELIPK